MPNDDTTRASGTDAHEPHDAETEQIAPSDERWAAYAPPGMVDDAAQDVDFGDQTAQADEAPSGSSDVHAGVASQVGDNDDDEDDKETFHPFQRVDPAPRLYIPPPSFGDWVRGLFGRDYKAAYQERYDMLNRAAQHNPDDAAIYLQRGELFLELRDYDRAAVDLQKAAELASADYETRPWGIVSQMVRDRALAALEQAQRKRR